MRSEYTEILGCGDYGDVLLQGPHAVHDELKQWTLFHSTLLVIPNINIYNMLGLQTPHGPPCGLIGSW
jgi:hypothetical protein